MACTIAVARRGQQRSLTRIFQVLSVTIARSAQARTLCMGGTNGYGAMNRTYQCCLQREDGARLGGHSGGSQARLVGGPAV